MSELIFFCYVFIPLKNLVTALEIVLLLYSPVDMSENVIMCTYFRGSGIENQVVYDFKCVDYFLVSVTS